MAKRNVISSESEILRHQSHHKRLSKRDTRPKNIIAPESEVFGMSVKGLRKLMLAEEAPEPEAPTSTLKPTIRPLFPPRVSVGQSPLGVRYAANYDEKKNVGWVKPMFSSIVYRLPVCRLVRNCSMKDP